MKKIYYGSLLLFASILAPLYNESISARETTKTKKLPLGVYRHFRGNLYQVISCARHSESLEELVVYQQLYGNYGIWVRPISLFTEKVFHNGKLMPRFTYLGPSFTALPKLR